MLNYQTTTDDRITTRDFSEFQTAIWQKLGITQNSYDNFLGYGMSSVHTPPLFVFPWELQPSVLQIHDKYALTMANPPWTVFSETYGHYLLKFIATFVQQLITSNFTNWDYYGILYQYENAAAIGNMMYPEGLLKYYDLYSIMGQLFYILEYIF